MPTYILIFLLHPVVTWYLTRFAKTPWHLFVWLVVCCAAAVFLGNAAFSGLDLIGVGIGAWVGISGFTKARAQALAARATSAPATGPAAEEKLSLGLEMLVLLAGYGAIILLVFGWMKIDKIGANEQPSVSGFNDPLPAVTSTPSNSAIRAPTPLVTTAVAPLAQSTTSHRSKPKTSRVHQHPHHDGLHFRRGVTTEKCVYRPVMTNNDYRACGATPMSSD